MSLIDTAERLASIDRSQIMLATNRCLHAFDRFSECARCFDLCPVEAILVGKPPTLASSSCKSCLACLPACPVGAFQADDSVANLLNCIPHIDGKTVEILCSLHPDPGVGEDSERTAVRIQGCLAGLGSGAYLAVIALSIEHIFLRTDACIECGWASLRNQVVQQAERVNTFMAALNYPADITCLDEIENPISRTLWEVKNPPLSRRDLFRMFGRQSQVALSRALERDLPHKSQGLGRDRLRWLAAAERLPLTAASTVIDSTGFDFASLVVSETCTACGVCVRACPTNTLSFEKNNNGNLYTLTVDVRNCIGCEACIHVCAPAAISINHAPTWAEIFQSSKVILREGELIKCESCGAQTAKRADVRLCPVCEYRQQHPFGNVTPSGLRHAGLTGQSATPVRE